MTNNTKGNMTKTCVTLIFPQMKGQQNVLHINPLETNE